MSRRRGPKSAVHLRSQNPAPKPTKPPPPPSDLDEERYTPWLRSLGDRDYSSSEHRLHDEILACVSYLNETSEEQALVAHVRKLASTTLQDALKQCEVLVFGSTDTGLRLPGSDIDLMISSADVYDKKSMLIKLAGVLRTKEWCKSANAILGARVPIVSFSTTDNFGSLKLDMGINNFNGQMTGEFVKRQLQQMPALRPLVFLIKTALSQRGLNDASQSGISSFAVICMGVFFLRVNPQKLPRESLSDPNDNKSLGSILCGFLKYYSRELPYKKMYISVQECRLLPKSITTWMTGDWADSLVIECPCTPERNITATLSTRKFEKIRGIFAHAHQVIEEATAPSRNILQTLVSVDAKFISYREHVYCLVQSGQIPSDGVRSKGGPSLGGGLNPRGSSLNTGIQRPSANAFGTSSSAKNARRS